MDKRRLRADIILIAVLLLISTAVLLITRLGKSGGAALRVTVNGETTAEYSLLKDGEHSLNGGTNILKIEDGHAYVIYADCPDKLCCHAGKISLTGERIVCLPNKLMIEVIGEDDVDFVS